MHLITENIDWQEGLELFMVIMAKVIMEKHSTSIIQITEQLYLVFLDEVYRWSFSLRHTGWPYLRTFYEVNPNLNCSLWFTMSQCSLINCVVMWGNQTDQSVTL